MATRALDVVTILHALDTLDRELQTTVWSAKNPQQIDLFTWLDTFKEKLARITGLDAKASRFYEELNAFLAQKGFSPMVASFNPKEGLGVVSILDKLVRWLNGPGTIGEIYTRRGSMLGFELPHDGVNIYEVMGYRGSYLLELLTQSDDTLWLFVHDNHSLDGLDMVKLSLDVMSKSRQTPMSDDSFGYGLGRGKSPTFAGAKVPMIEFDVKPDLSWLLGAKTTTVSGDYYFVAQAAQQFKMRMDETGARVKVATAMVVPLMWQGPVVFEVKEPFYGWWTQKGINLPMAAFFADWDAWRKPSGSLEDL